MSTVDLDQENTPNSRVLYSLVSQTPLLKESGFKIDRDSGEIRLSGCSDYEVTWTLPSQTVSCVLPLSPGTALTSAAGNPPLDLLRKLLKWNLSLLTPPFPPHTDCSSVHTTDQSEGLRGTTAVGHGHGSRPRAGRQPPQAHIHPEQCKPRLPPAPSPTDGPSPRRVLLGESPYHPAPSPFSRT